MNFQAENNPEWINCIDCYWESHEMGNQELYTYPSLPEPYINIYFPIASDGEIRLKGISSQSDYFEMRTKLFGVRLFLRGYYQLHLIPCAEVSNRIVNIKEMGGPIEVELSDEISKADSFTERVSLFRAYFKTKDSQPLSNKESNIADAFSFLVNNYKTASVITHYANESGYSSRTITRWFSSDIGINPKKLVKIIRFHKALEGLHSHKEPGFYFDCGYYDQPHFIRDFKEFTGLTPAKYLKMVSDLYN